MSLDVGFDDVDDGSVGARCRALKPISEIVPVRQKDSNHQGPLKFADGYGRVILSEPVQLLRESEDVLTNISHHRGISFARGETQLHVAIIAQDGLQQPLECAGIDPQHQLAIARRKLEIQPGVSGDDRTKGPNWPAAPFGAEARSPLDGEELAENLRFRKGERRRTFVAAEGEAD